MATTHTEEEHSVPDEYDDLDELPISPLVQNPNEQSWYRPDSPFEKTRNRRSSRVKVISPSRTLSRTKTHDLFDRQKIRQPGHARRQSDLGQRRQVFDTLEQHQTPQSQHARRQSEGENANLTELSVPAPALLEDEEPSPPSSGGEGKHKVRVTPRRERVSQLATKVYTVSYLILFSILGTLARLGLQALVSYPGDPVVTGVIWPNFAGSLIMGFLIEDRKLFQQEWGPSKDNLPTTPHSTKHKEKDTEAAIAADKKRHGSVKKTIPLYIGLTTGFCGSFTSFSAFVRDLFLALSNALPVPVAQLSPSTVPINPTSLVPRNGGYSFMAVVAIVLLTTTLCLGALQFGAHLAIALEPLTPSIPLLLSRKIVDRAMVVLSFGAWAGAILMAMWPPDAPDASVGHHRFWSQETWRGEVLFALCFAPIGCLSRYYVSLLLNGKIASFPLGTFAVNIFGVIIEGLCYDLQHAPLGSTARGLVGGGHLGCQLLQGVQDGFCGCLTTVSTWVAELKGLRRWHAYVYGGVTVCTAIAFMVVIMGSLKWTRGFATPICVT